MSTEADPDAVRIARKVLASDSTVTSVARLFHRFVDPMTPGLGEKDPEMQEVYRREARRALRAALGDD